MDTISQSLLARLGLDAEPGPPEHIHVAPSVVGEGRGFLAGVLTAAQAFSSTAPAAVNWLPLQPVALVHTDLEHRVAQQHPSWHYVTSKSGAPLEVAAEHDAGVYRLGRSSVGLDLDATGRVALKAADTAEIVELRDNVVSFHPVPLSEIQIAPLAVVNPPLGEWLADCADAWLRDELRQRLARAADDWDRVVAAGLYGRLLKVALTPRIPLDLQPAIAQAWRAQRWASDLDPAAIDTLRRLAWAELASLDLLAGDVLDKAPDADDGADPAWERDVVACAHARDDLDTVRVLLDASGSAGELGAALAAFDERCADALVMAAAGLHVDDERLRRVAAGDPEAWWAQIAEDDDDRDE